MGQVWYYYFYSRGGCCSAVKEYAYVTEVCRAKSAQGPYVDRDGKDCAEKNDGQTNGSGTILLESHSLDGKGRYQILAPGSVGIVVRPLDPFIYVLIYPSVSYVLMFTQFLHWLKLWPI